LVQQHPGQLLAKDLLVGFGGEISVLRACGCVDRYQSIDQLAQARLALFVAHCTVEVLTGDDDDCVYRPEVVIYHVVLYNFDLTSAVFILPGQVCTSSAVGCFVLRWQAATSRSCHVWPSSHRCGRRPGSSRRSRISFSKSSIEENDRYTLAKRR